jgi:hypothetical protein
MHLLSTPFLIAATGNGPNRNLEFIIMIIIGFLEAPQAVDIEPDCGSVSAQFF